MRPTTPVQAHVENLSCVENITEDNQYDSSDTGEFLLDSVENDNDDNSSSANSLVTLTSF